MKSFADIPLSPRRVPFFYGWIVLAAGTLGIISSMPGQTMGVSVFTDSLIEATGLTRKQLSLAYLFGTLVSGFLLIPGGRLVDRFGVRLMNVVASAGLGVSLLALSRIESVVETAARLTGGRGVLALSFFVAMAGFFFIRFFGQGLLAMIPRVMIGRWFSRRRGLAMGISGVFTSFAFGSCPPVFNLLVERFGWQGAYVFLAVAVGVGTNLLAWSFFREQPSDHGLQPDGDQLSPDAIRSVDDFDVVRDFTVAETVKSYPFWVFSLGLGSNALVITAVTFHIMSLAEHAGMDSAAALNVFLPISVLSVTTNFVAGWASDRTPLKYLLFLLLATQALGTAGVIVMGTLAGRIALVIGYGLSGGIWGCLVGVTWPKYFGLVHLGGISGLNMSVMVVCSSLGPYLLGEAVDRTGNYTSGLVVCLVLPLILLAASLGVRNPQTTAR